ncbi:MAG: DUF1540 domain-containing protein [Clostridiales bacterium]|jgi:hypothetical protein|nr:DUF1540 domain-containing protein [Clostridiales bacterium]
MAQGVKCSVASCKYNENSSKCNLNNIQVEKCDASGESHEKRQTECGSFSQE